VSVRGGLTRLAAVARSKRIGGLAALVAVALLAGGCGGGDDEVGEIPADRAEQLLSQLESVRTLAANGECEEAEQQASAFGDAVDDLPAEAGTDLKEALRGGAASLGVVISDECEEPVGTTEPTSTTPAATTSTSTSTSTETATEEDEAPPVENNGNGNSNGGGNGSGGTSSGDE
jgi:hypothetical protein